jgi:hypothetical protein
MKTEKGVFRFIYLIGVRQKLYLDTLLDKNLGDLDYAKILLIIFSGRNINELFCTV